LKPKVDGEELLLELGKLGSGECLIANDSSYEGLGVPISKGHCRWLGVFSSLERTRFQAACHIWNKHQSTLHLGWKLSYEIIWYGASDLKVDSSGIVNYLKRRAA
jgi:hypothetical protein